MAISPETKIQMQVIRWVDQMAQYDPRYKWVYHAKNENARDARQGALYKKLGVRAGVVDLCVPLPVAEFHGMYMELKDGNKKPSQKQIHFMSEMVHRGYYVALCGDAASACKVIDDYINGRVVHSEY